METEQIALTARALYGFHLTVHYLFSDVPIGLSTIGVILSVVNLIYKNNSEEIREKYLQLFSVSWILAATSALVYELEYRHNWLGVDEILTEFYKRPWITDIPMLGFFLTGIILMVCFKRKLWINDKAFLSLNLFLFISAITTNLWAITLNTLMQLPEGISYSNGYLQLDSGLSPLVFSRYNLLRLLHIIGSATIKAGIMIGLTVAIDRKRMLPEYLSYHRFMLKTVLLFIVITGISGHFKVLVIAEKRVHTFLMMEGIKDTSTKSNICLFCLPDKEKNIQGWSIKNGMRYLMPAKLYEGLDQNIGTEPYNNYGESIFTSYHVMLWGWLMLSVSVVLALFLKNPSIYLHLFMLGTALISILCGWYVAELGRQPWAFWGIVKVNELITPGLTSEHLYLSKLVTVVNTFVLFIMAIFATIFVIKPLRK